MRFGENWKLSCLVSGSQDERTGKFGHTGNVFAGLELNKWYAGWVTKWVSQDYTPGMGCVFGQNIIHHNPVGYYVWRPKKEKSLARRADPGFFVNYYHNASDGKFQQADLYFFPVYVFFRDNSFLEMSLIPTWLNINFIFSPLNVIIPQGRYFYTRYLVNYETDQSRKISASLKAEFYRFYDGRSLTLRPDRVLRLHRMRP